MQAVEAQTGVSCRSKLFESLKLYLNNKNRLQPIIGLGSIIECMRAGTYKREILYLCEVCVCRLSKTDIWNHITGSLHRYNYIKTWYSQLVSEWKENSDLSKLARPLMDIAKLLERKEGPGEVQLLEVDDAMYQKMASYNGNDAITLINSLRDGLGEGEPEECTPLQLEHSSPQSHRIVLLSQNQQRWSEKSIKADVISFSTPTQTNKPPPLSQSSVAPPIKSEGWLKNISSSWSDKKHISPELSFRKNHLDGYTGAKPLIGLVRVIECKSENGRTYCFLCHCCRIRLNKMDIVDHLTGSSHLINYLMETHPEQVGPMMADTNNCQFLQSLAKKVEQEEGRGELKVVNAPESLCNQLTGKSYHWCINKLCNGSTHTSIQKKKIPVKGSNVDKTSVQWMSKKHAKVLSKQARRRAKRKMTKITNTVFKVSLPLTKGPVLVERTSFSKDSLPVLPGYLPSSTPLSPESQTEGCELLCEARPFTVNHADHTSVRTTPQLQQDLYSEDADTDQYIIPEGNSTVAVFHEVDGYLSKNKYFNQSEDTGTKFQKGERNYNRPHGSQEELCNNFNKELTNQGLQAQYEGPMHAVSHSQHLSYYNPSFGYGEGYTEGWYSPALQSKLDIRAEVSREEGQKEMNSGMTQHPDQQQSNVAQDCTSLMTSSVGQYGLSGESVSRLDSARINMQYHFGGFIPQSGSPALDPRAQFLETEQRQLQTYMEFTVGHAHTAPQSYMPPGMTYQAIQVGYGVRSDPNYNTVSRTTQLFSHPVSHHFGRDTSQSNAFIPHGQGVHYGTQSDLNFRANGLSGLLMSGSDEGTAPRTSAHHNFNSPYVATPYRHHVST
ncbi:uncharacterized protein LOC113126417 [Mastacembelus armatus]|uniref:uncharacterized protein LOC113126417 n=1 Tax=Mastacembelus armatus TaxID=205130 RepID=UPI000E461507|nr:uncharacterized protein LOC113126417 [Mastacembelus armatus]